MNVGEGVNVTTDLDLGSVDRRRARQRTNPFRGALSAIPQRRTCALALTSQDKDGHPLPTIEHATDF